MGAKSLTIETEADEHEALVLTEAATYPPLRALDDTANPPEAVQGPSGWVYHSTSLGWMRPHHRLRFVAIHIVESPIFDPFIMITIMCNCITMAWASPLDPPGTEKAAFLAYMEWVYLYIFTFELVMKILAYGLICHPHSYLRDAWCQLDFVVVSLAWLPLLFPSMGSMNAIRSVRALRPLRALKRVPGMPVLVGSILQSLPPLANVAGVTTFFFVVFGIVGMELFGGVRRCMACAHPSAREAGMLSRTRGVHAVVVTAATRGASQRSAHAMPCHTSAKHRSQQRPNTATLRDQCRMPSSTHVQQPCASALSAHMYAPLNATPVHVTRDTVRATGAAHAMRRPTDPQRCAGQCPVAAPIPPRAT